VKVAIIPARGGSKRIPRKNIRLFAGKPIIAHSIGAAIDSGCFDRVIVSTDDPEIASVAREWGAETPFLRPSSIADDHAGTGVVMKHALKWLVDQGTPAGLACCLYATAPFVQASTLQLGLARLIESDCSYSFTVTSFPFPVQRAVRIMGDGTVDAIWPENIARRSQDLEHAFHDAGQFYWGKAAAFLNDVVLFSCASAAIVLPRHMVQDIDTLEDWHRAELMFRILQEEKESRVS